MPPQSLDDRFVEDRHRMVREQLAARGISNARVLAAMGEVPREQFVPAHAVDSAYRDSALPLTAGQTISQPYTVAFMCNAADPQPTDHVLEIGTGSGYGAAVLSRLAECVHTVERLPELAAAAQQRLQRLNYDNVTVHRGDGSEGLPQQAPFDVILVTAAAGSLPEPYAEQLAEGGRIVIPIGATTAQQTMMRFRRQGSKLIRERMGGFAFVPLIGRFGTIHNLR